MVYLNLTKSIIYIKIILIYLINLYKRPFYGVLKELFMLKLKYLFTTHHSQFTVKTIAFTLAETLIVIGVIGIVSALTLPNLNSSTGEKEKVAKVKKIYQNLNDAFGRAIAVYGPYEEWFIMDGGAVDKIAKRQGERISEFMKLSKNCGLRHDGCIAKVISDYEQSYKILTVDGTSVVFGDSGDGTVMYIDIDGPTKGKNEVGQDIFRRPLVRINDSLISVCDDISFVFDERRDEGSCRFWWIVTNGNMDYLKADKDGKCSNGIQLSETVTSCK